MSHSQDTRKRRSTDPYGFKRLGNYGVFKSNGSFPIEYLQTTFFVDELEDLTLARDVSPERIDFELLMQRDIDEGRVKDKMIPYLSASKETKQVSAKTTFFPPILVAALPVNSDTINHYYSDEITAENNEEKLEREWPGFFKVEYFKEARTGASPLQHFHNLEEKNTSVDFHDVKMSFKLARNNIGTKLVVIDGQHRLYALTELAKSKFEAIKDLVVPVCILFPPRATEGLKDTNYPDVIQVFRHLFVDVNTTMELVGGHFNILLSDSSIGSLFCREFCNFALESSLGINALATIEWNTKNKKDSTIIKRQYSITSIGVLNKALTESLKSKQKKGVFKYILNHSEIDADLAAVSSDGLSDVNWDKFEHSQSDCLKKQIKKRIVPMVFSIFFESKAYKNLYEIFVEEFESVVALSEKDDVKSIDAKNVIRHLTQYVPLNGDDSKKILKIMETDIQDKKEARGLSFLTYAIFQRAVIRAWVEFIDYVKSAAIPVEVLTEIFIKILDHSCRSNLLNFRKESVHMRFAVWGMMKIKPKDETVVALKNFILGCLGNETYQRTLLREYSLSEELDNLNLSLVELGYDCASDYMKHYEKERKKDFTMTYSVNFETLDDEQRENLRLAEDKLKHQNALVRKGELNKEEVRDDFSPLVTKHVKEDVELAHASLKEALGIKNDIYVFDGGENSQEELDSEDD